MINRKFKKLVRDPKLFFSDMLLKQNQKISKLKPKKFQGESSYSIVSAVYNVEKYLDKYFESIISQRLDFKENIKIILVDDGSTDASKDIIRKWQKRHPNNIKYIYKENGGQASARNIGLQYVESEWVTFIDPDDFIDINYFLSADNCINSNKKNRLKLISCNFIFYFEDKNKLQDTHPLKHRFINGDKLVSLDKLGKNIQLSVNSALFRTQSIKDNKIKFDESIKPNFEDAHFANMYLMHNPTGNAVFLKSAKYYYRKRSDGSSTLDKSWDKTGLYNEVLVNGCLNLLTSYQKKYSYIPENIQITIIYHLIWYFKKIINNNNALSFLSAIEKNKFIKRLDEIFSFIDDKTILEFNLAGAWFYHKIGILAAFKQRDPNFQIVYIEGYDPIKNMVQLRYFCRLEQVEIIEVDGKDTFPSYAKTIKHDFVGREFIKERRIWINISKNQILKVKISDIKTTISLAGKQYASGINGSIISKHFFDLTPDYVVKNEHSNSWILMDRDFQADDNAEHLYRFIKENHPNQKIYFALNKTSHDWIRLENEGFNLLDFGSEKHKKILSTCAKVISSHVDHCVVNLLGPKMLINRHFIFLQHGITKDDLSSWLNQKDNIDCFITASKDEYNSIIENSSRYKFSSKEVKLTGFPRHDKLIEKSNVGIKKILIMPTWRSNISGPSQRQGHERVINPKFSESNFSLKWREFFNCKELREICNKNNYDIVFFPHPNLIPYIESFNIPNHIEILNPSAVRMQDVFTDSSLLITDYSSVAFEMAIQNKQTIYYQFDEDDIFSGSHTYSQGYYKYRDHGFGPVCNEKNEVLHELDILLNNNAIPSKKIQKRIDRSLPFRDGKCCQRTYEAITSLDDKDEDYFDIDLARSSAIQASNAEFWTIAKERWDYLHCEHSQFIDVTDTQKYIESLVHTGNIYEAKEKFTESFGTNRRSYNDIQLALHCRIATILGDWHDAKKCWEELPSQDEDYLIYYPLCCAYLKLTSEIENFSSSSNSKEYDSYIIFCKLLSQENWDEIIAKYEEADPIQINNKKILKTIKYIYSKSKRESNDYHGAKKFLTTEFNEYEKGSLWLDEYILTCYSTKDFKTVIRLLSANNNYIEYFKTDKFIMYLESLRLTNNVSEAFNILNLANEELINEVSVRNEIAQLHFVSKNWASSAESWLNLVNTSYADPYKLAYSYRMLGMIEESFCVLNANDFGSQTSLEYLLLKAELAQLLDDWPQVASCWNAMLRYHQNDCPHDAMLRLQNAQLILKISELNEKSLN